VDILERLEKWLEKDQIVARNWNEDGFSIDGDIEDAVEEIKQLRYYLTNRSSGQEKIDSYPDPMGDEDK